MNSLPEITNKELHKALGKCFHEESKNKFCFKCDKIQDKSKVTFYGECDDCGLHPLDDVCKHCNIIFVDGIKNTDYYNDLNAMAKIEAKFDEKEALEYARAIGHLITKESPTMSNLKLTAMDYLFANPRHRAEAALKVLKKEKE